jgi:hypothetical protein
MSDFIPFFSGGPEIFGEEYNTKVLTVDRANLIGYWPMWEPSGGDAFDLSPEGNDGAYTGVTLGQAGIGDGRTCPLFDGANDYNDIYSAALNTDFDGAEGTLLVWAKVTAGVWTDNTNRKLVHVGADISENYVTLWKVGDNNLAFTYEAGNTLSQVYPLAITPSGWFVLAITWSKSGDKVIAYHNGAQTGSTLTSLGTWSGALDSTLCVVGAQSITPTHPWSGTLAHAALWTTPLTAPQIASLAVV